MTLPLYFLGEILVWQLCWKIWHQPYLSAEWIKLENPHEYFSFSQLSPVPPYKNVIYSCPDVHVVILIVAWWCHMASKFFVTTNKIDGLSLNRCQAIAWASAGILLFRLHSFSGGRCWLVHWDTLWKGRRKDENLDWRNVFPHILVLIHTSWPVPFVLGHSISQVTSLMQLGNHKVNGKYHKPPQWASYQIRTMAGRSCSGNACDVFTPPRVSNPDMHHGTCVTSWADRDRCPLTLKLLQFCLLCLSRKRNTFILTKDMTKPK